MKVTPSYTESNSQVGQKPTAFVHTVFCTVFWLTCDGLLPLFLVLLHTILLGVVLLPALGSFIAAAAANGLGGSAITRGNRHGLALALRIEHTRHACDTKTSLA